MLTGLCWSERHEKGSHEVGKRLGKDDSLPEVKALHFKARACDACVEINSVRVHGWISSPIGFVDPTTLYFIVLYRVPSRRVDRLLTTGHRVVVDADLSDYFGQIPHADLMKSIARRVSDGRLLGWVKAWLEMAVEEDEGGGGRRRTNRARRERKGTPQGSPISPLFSNIYIAALHSGLEGAGLRPALQGGNRQLCGRPRSSRPRTGSGDASVGRSPDETSEVSDER